MPGLQWMVPLWVPEISVSPLTESHCLELTRGWGRDWDESGKPQVLFLAGCSHHSRLNQQCAGSGSGWETEGRGGERKEKHNGRGGDLSRDERDGIFSSYGTRNASRWIRTKHPLNKRRVRDLGRSCERRCWFDSRVKHKHLWAWRISFVAGLTLLSRLLLFFPWAD